ncbi:MAG TPA: DUF1080 domain-containing protein [Opitutaceae bacterium]|nr:DUF1080 domain-containing protein [Opitutaceae bacterium]
MKFTTRCSPAALFRGVSILTLLAAISQAAPDPRWLGHDRLRPAPEVVDPGYPSTAEKPGKAPSDAVVLFDGGDLHNWAAMDGKPSKWTTRDGAMECVPGSGYIRTLQCFGECQLHLEFATPTPPKGNSQGRGNSGVFFGMGRYEVQVLDSYQNKTYSDGSCGSIYNQYPPLVNASKKPGEWQTYDIVWTPPKFKADGSLASAARATVFHNGVLIQNNVELIGETSWLQRAPFKAHPEKLPLALQDHGNPVRYRNIWVRELDHPTHPEFYLPDATLDSYVGTYENAEFVRHESTLLLKFEGAEIVLYASSPTHFFSKVVDIQADFDPAAKSVTISVGEDGGMKKQRK